MPGIDICQVYFAFPINSFHFDCARRLLVLMAVHDRLRGWVFLALKNLLSHHAFLRALRVSSSIHGWHRHSHNIISLIGASSKDRCNDAVQMLDESNLLALRVQSLLDTNQGAN